MATQLLEGTWEEIAAHADELAGKRLRVIVETDAPGQWSSQAWARQTNKLRLFSR